MSCILMSSGFPASVIAQLRRRWEILDVPDQLEAVSLLRAGHATPDVIVIGHVGQGRGHRAKEVMGEIQEIAASIPVIISTHADNPETIVDLVKHGAFDYVVEAEDWAVDSALQAYVDRLSLALEKALQWRAMFEENRRLKRDLAAKDMSSEIIARSEPMLEVLDLVRKVAPTTATVIISGESGTGKECIAKMVHGLSHAREEPFIAVNCGSMNDQLLASEIFGHVKGAYTGAHADRPGLLREAGKGTLFLDEIGTVSQAFQIMLLRVLEQRTARPVGGSSEHPVQARFVAAANQDIPTLVEQGGFREDLWYRLSVFHIRLPPLRDRVEDIPALALHFLNQACAAFGKSITGIDPVAMGRLETHDWPGNVRQLRNVMERASIVCEGDRITAGDLELGRAALRPAPSRLAPADMAYDRAMERFERRLLTQAIVAAKGNVTKAAELLQMKRTTLHYRMKSLDMPLTRQA